MSMMMRSDWPTSEPDVAVPMAAWMRSMGWEIFPEVELRLSGRADMVGRRKVGEQELYYAVEVKRRFGLKVLEQAIRHTSTVHYTAIAVPKMKSSMYSSRAAQTVLKKWGIGLYEVTRVSASLGWREGHLNKGVIHLEDERCAHTEQDREEGLCSDPEECDLGYRIKELEEPKLHRIKDFILERYVNLVESQKGVLPGNADAEYWTPWRETCRRVEEFVEENPGCTTTELLDGITHHYASENSARSSIPQWIRAGKIDVRLKKRGGKLYYYPPEE